jgi:hypothetical protein
MSWLSASLDGIVTISPKPRFPPRRGFLVAAWRNLFSDPISRHPAFNGALGSPAFASIRGESVLRV